MEEALARYADTVLAAGAARALAVAVTDGERTLALHAGGEASPATLFEIGSIGKSFTAIVALQLEREGLVDLQAPVTDLLPWFRVRGDASEISLHHLLTHSSGLPQGPEISTASNFDVVEMAAIEPGFRPGQHFWYSNVGYRTIGWALERASGRTYPDLVRERILDVLGMRNSEPWIVQEMRPRLAQAWVPAYDDRPWRPEHGLAPAPWIDSAEADGCICTTLGDLAVYLRALMSRDERLLDAERWGRMLGAVIEVDQEDEGGFYGYGISVGDGGFGHSGGMIGHHAQMTAGDDGLGAVAAISGVTGAGELAAAALAIARGEGPQPFAVRPAGTVTDDGSCPPDLRALLGHYRAHNPWLTNFRVTAHEGGLVYSTSHVWTDRQPLVAVGDGVFRIGAQAWSPERLWFDTEIDGVMQRAWRSGAAYHRTFTP